ncbi:MAG TPA: DUF4402 domain-containing protein [Balneolales bacterium]|nr:DUF4402 domain-containing protein [Balneolales bacterium]
MNDFFKKGVVLCFAFISLINAVYGQSIQFNGQVPLSFTVVNDINFGQVVTNEGLVRLNKGDNGMGVLKITGQKNMDITINIPSSVKLYDASNTNYMNYTIRAAYNNKGQNDYTQTQPFNVPSQTFRVGGRNQGPPAPPPTPAHHGYIPPTGSAWLYLFGNLNVTNVPVGQYHGTITITVIYN